MSDIQKPLRYPIGSKQYFIWIDFTKGKENQAWSSLFLPWTDTLNKIDIKALTCVEHHKVAWDQDPKEDKQYDGFVFTEEECGHKSGKWFNQFPSACYSQTSNDCDFQVSPDLTVDEINVMPKNQLWAQHQDVKIFLARALKGVHDLKEKGQNSQSLALEEFCKKVVDVLKNDFKVEVCVETTKLKNKDGTFEEISGFFNVTLKSIT